MLEMFWRSSTVPIGRSAENWLFPMTSIERTACHSGVVFLWQTVIAVSSVKMQANEVFRTQIREMGRPQPGGGVKYGSGRGPVPFSRARLAHGVGTGRERSPHPVQGTHRWRIARHRSWSGYRWERQWHHHRYPFVSVGTPNGSGPR